MGGSQTAYTALISLGSSPQLRNSYCFDIFSFVLCDPIIAEETIVEVRA
jgi:hypothetical protein